jgi:hypothetical protein
MLPAVVGAPAKKASSPAATNPPPAGTPTPATTTKGFSLSISDPADNTRKTLFKGEEAIRHADGSFTIKRLHMETYRAQNQLELIVEAPECRLEPTTQNVSSSGSLKVRRADGLFTLEGEGFRWETKSKRLVVTNRVQTIIQQKLVGPPAKKS